MDKTAYLMGYWDGKRTKANITTAQAKRYLKGLPQSAIDSYIAGHADGVAGDETTKNTLA